MRILGIDPGIGRMGWGVLVVQNQELRIISYGCIETSKELSVEKRLFAIHEKVCEFIKEYSIEEVAVEELFFNTNVTTAFAVGQARGVVLLAAARGGVPIFSYTPLQIKMAITGYGRADKKQIGQMVKTLLKLSKIPSPDDTCDALATAITHGFSYKLHKYIA